MEEGRPRPRLSSTAPIFGLMPSSAEKIASCDDLLIEILSCLPIKSLFQFKCVSKHWLFLINSPYFSRRRYPYPYTRPSGLFLYRFRLDGLIISDPDFIPLQTSTTSCPSLLGTDILHSCNGLLITYQKKDNEEYNYYVYNPTTQISIELPHPGEGCSGFVQGMYLAFDPQKSMRYKVVGVWRLKSSESRVQIKVFSSELGTWRNAIAVNMMTDYVNFRDGVYWNGAINLISHWGKNSLYFNVDDESLGELPMVPLREHWGSPFAYFGESRGHLHLIEIYGQRKTRFHVYEMKRDYSEWFVLYDVDLEHEFTREIPECMTEAYCEFKILTLVREEKDEDSYLVIHVLGNIIRYNLSNKSSMKLQNIDGAVDELFPWHGALGCIDSHAFEYIESLWPV